MSSNKPIRILQVVNRMAMGGGVQAWLMNVVRNIDRKKFNIDFMVHTTEPSQYHDEIRSLGSRIFPCVYPKNITYAKNFHRLLREYGHYDIVHSNFSIYNGYVLRLSAKAGIPRRIAHSHVIYDIDPTSTFRRICSKINRRLVAQYATHGIGVSRDAARGLFGEKWESDPRWKVIHCGVDLTPFQQPVDTRSVKEQLGIPRHVKVVGNVSRFCRRKNHTFLIRIMKEIAYRRKDIWFLLVGDGPLKTSIEEKVATMGLQDRFVFTGVRRDVPRLMMGAMDVFLFPSLYEGLGLVLIEAQAAGVPCVISDVLPREARIIKELVELVPLSRSPGMWADRVIDTIDKKAKSSIKTEEYRARINNSDFNLNVCIDKLCDFYRQ